MAQKSGHKIVVAALALILAVRGSSLIADTYFQFKEEQFKEYAVRHEQTVGLDIPGLSENTIEAVESEYIFIHKSGDFRSSGSIRLPLRFAGILQTVFDKIYTGSLNLFAPKNLFAAPPTSAFTPGETLDPSCSPGAAFCTVAEAAAGSDGQLQYNNGGAFGGASQFVFASTTGNVGIGTTSPYAKLSVGGEVVAGFFTATTSATSTLAGGLSTNLLRVTSTSASSTFSNGINLTAGCFSINGTCVGGSSGSSFGEAWAITTNIFSQSALAPTTTQNIAVNGVGTSTFAGGLEAWRQISAPFFHATSTTATSTFAGLLSVGTTTASTTAKLFIDGGILVTDSVGSVAIGNTTLSATGTSAVSVGIGNIAGGANSSSFGSLNNVSRSGSVAFGRSNTISHTNAVAVGITNTSSGSEGSAFGTSNTASGFRSMAIGHFNTASGSYGSAFGRTNTASENSTSAFGFFNTASGYRSSAFGYRNTASGSYSVAIGSNIKNGVANSLQIGNSNSASLTILSTGETQAPFFTATSTTASSTFANGINLTAGCFSINGTCVGGSSGSSFGEVWAITTNVFSQSALAPTTTQNIAVNGVGTSTFAGGLEAWRQISAPIFIATSTTGTSTFNNAILVTSPFTSVAIGNGIFSATGTGATAVGVANLAGGSGSSAVGSQNIASGSSSSASGYYNRARSQQSSAFGYVNTASGNSSSAVGSGNTASGNYSSAFGDVNLASGIRSSAFGYSTVASGSNSSVFGNTSTASADYAVAIGRNIRNGLASSLQAGVSNAASLTILSTGETKIPFVTATTTDATSTFQRLGADILRVSTTTATSTFAYGINLAGGCFAINGTCVGGSGSSFTLGEAWSLTTNTFGQSALQPTTTQNILVNGVGTSTFAGGLSAFRQFSTPFLQATSTTATSTFAGAVAVGTTTASIDAKLSVHGGLFITSNTQSIAIGNGATLSATGTQAINLGILNLTGGSFNNIAIGQSNTAFGSDNSIAIGYQTNVLGQRAIAFGYQQTASGQYSTALGNKNTTSASNSTAVGNNSTASGTGSSSFGFNNTVNGTNGLVVGAISDAVGNASNAVGYDNTSSAYANAFGYHNITSSGAYASAFGSHNTASNSNTSAFGFTNTVSGSASSAFGSSNVVAGANALAFGASNSASADYAIAIGRNIKNGLGTSLQAGVSNAASLTILSTGELKAPFFTATTTGATSTFKGLSADLLQISSTTATSTFANGINLTAGCFSINGTCVGGAGSGTVNSGTAGFLAYYAGSGTAVSETPTLFWDNTNKRLGIGTTSPSQTLTVGGGIYGSSITLSTTTATSTIAGLLSVGTTTSTTTAKLFVDGGVFVSSSVGSIAIGNTRLSATGTNAVSIGIANLAGGANSTAVGSTNSAFGAAASAFGRSNTALSDNASAIGDSNIATGGGASAFGNGNEASDLSASAFGGGNTASAGDTSAFGVSNNATNDQSNAFGHANTASGAYSSAFGTSNIISGTSAVAFGTGNTISVTGSSAFGSNINNDIASSAQIGPSNAAKLTILSTGEVRGSFFTATSTGATSTFKGLSADLLQISSTTATSTFANGINLTAGCFSINGTCVGGGGSGTVTSVALSVPTGFTVSGSPVTTSGTLALGVSFSNNAIIGSNSAGTGLIATGTADRLTVHSLVATSTTATSTIAGLLSVGTTTSTTTAKLFVDGGVFVSSSVGSIAIGNTALSATGTRATAVGVANLAGGTDSSAFGSSNTAFGLRGTAVGRSNIASHTDTVAVGNSNQATSTNSAVFGFSNLAGTGENNFAAGLTNTVSGGIGATGLNSAFGQSNTISGGAAGASAFGYGNTISTASTLIGASAVGYSNTISANYAFAFGKSITNATANSVMIGPSNTAKITILSTGEVQAPFFTATTTGATSTFKGLSADLLQISSTTATSTFANGINLTAGCFSINGTCVGGSGGTPGGSDGQIQYNNGGSFGGGTGFIWDDTNNLFGVGTTTPYAKLSVSGSVALNSNIIQFASSSATTLNLQYLARATSTIPNNTPYAWTIATSTTASPLFRIDTTTGSETVTFGTTGGDVIVGDVGTASNLVFEESSTIHGQGGNTLTFGQSGDKINFAVATGFGTSTPVSTVSIQGSLCVRDTGSCGTTSGTIYATTAAISDIDLAENYQTTDDTLSAGEVVALDTTTSVETSGFIKRATRSEGGRLLGIISTKPGVLLGKEITNAKPVALAGRVPVKINLDGGAIQPGDRIALSSVAGVGMRATTTGETFAIALEEYDGSGDDSIEVFIDLEEVIEPSQLSIDTQGNVGIGTTTPNYKLHVVGDVAANGFVNTSTRNSKTDISYLKDEDYDAFLTKLGSINVATYRYFTDATTTPINRLGLIAEEAPSEVLSINKDGVDLYKLTTFTLGATKAQYKKIQDLEIRLEKLEGTGITGTGGGVSVEVILQALENLGTQISNGITRMKNVFVENLTVGSVAKPSGITLYDEVTGDPYCLKIVNGATVTIQGTCVVSDDNNSNDGGNNGGGGTDQNTDTEAPVITVNGNNPAHIEIGASYVDLGATVTDNVNNNLGIVVQGEQIDTSVAGNHTIIYTATDQAGNVGTATREVIVGDSSLTEDEPVPNENPEPTPEPTLAPEPEVTPTP